MTRHHPAAIVATSSDNGTEQHTEKKRTYFVAIMLKRLPNFPFPLYSAVSKKQQPFIQ